MAQVTGNIVKIEQVDGKAFYAFTLAVKKGEGKDAPTQFVRGTFYPGKVFAKDKTELAVAELKVGDFVNVFGNFEAEAFIATKDGKDYNGKEYKAGAAVPVLRINSSLISRLWTKTGGEPAPADAPTSKIDDFEDDIPF